MNAAKDATRLVFRLPTPSGERRLRVGDRLQVHVGRTAQTIVTIQGPGFCRRGLIGCRQPFIWCLTATGAKMPVDPLPDEAGIYTSHWATCPEREQFRRTRP